jgi:hypothetical protein
MTRVLLDLLAEPTDDLYRGLIDYATADCEIALLVVRKSIPLNTGGKGVLARLDAFLKQKKECSEWPGTKLFDKTAWVFQYKLGSECAAILKQATDALYGWRQPNLPEDLCFLRANGDPWLVSIAHERDGFLHLSQDERGHLFDALPMLESLVESKAL